MTKKQARLLELTAEALLELNTLNGQTHEELQKALKAAQRERRTDHRTADAMTEAPV